MRRASVLPVIAAALAAAPAAQAASPPLLGGQGASAKHAPRTAKGTARAQRAKAKATAQARQLLVHVARGSTAKRVRAGLYSDRRGRPGRLLTSGSARVTRRGAWLEISLGAASLRAGRHYWIATLATGGSLRSGRRGTCRAETTRARSLRRLPKRWPRARRNHRCAPAAYAPVLSGPGGGGAPGPGGGGGAGPVDPLNPGGVLRSPPQAIGDAARSMPLIRYGRRYPGGGDVSEGWAGGAPIVLAITSYTGNTSADARLLEQIRDTLAGGNEPVADGGYTTQHERWATGMLAIARHTPRIWNQLSVPDRSKANLVMTGALVASAFTTSDRNPYVNGGGAQRTLDGDQDVNRDWNPNYREGMVGMLPVAASYFGSGAAAQAVLDGFSASRFLADVRAAGLSNLAETYALSAGGVPSAAQVEQTVHGTWSYHGVGIGDPMPVAWAVTEDTYQTQVACGLNGGAGISTSDGPSGTLVSGCSGLPNKGATGQLKELDTLDAGGPRSSAWYAYDSYRTNLVNQLSLITGGLWKPGQTANAIVGRLAVGAPDLWYKLDHGYRGYAKAESQWVPDAPDPGDLRSDNPNFAFPLARSLWQDVAAPYLGRAKRVRGFAARAAGAVRRARG